MNRKQPLTHEEIDIIVKCLAECVLIDDLSILTENDWRLMLFENEQLTVLKMRLI